MCGSTLVVEEWIIGWVEEVVSGEWVGIRRRIRGVDEWSGPFFFSVRPSRVRVGRVWERIGPCLMQAIIR